MFIQRQTINSIPVVIMHEEPLESAVSKGCILCYHGLTSSKDDWLHDLKQIAEQGFMVVGIDNADHGERKHPDFAMKYSEDNPKFWEHFTDAIQMTASEMPLLIDELVKRSFALEHKVGALGVSMGGFIVYSAILLEPRLSKAVTLVSAPEWWGLEHPNSPHHDIEKFSNIKLLSITAGKDSTVPNHYTYIFHERLRAYYDDYNVRFRHQDYPTSDHMMNPDWESAWKNAIEWFEILPGNK